MFRRCSSPANSSREKHQRKKVSQNFEELRVASGHFISYLLSSRVIRGQERVCCGDFQSPILLAAVGIAAAGYRLRRRRGRDVEHTDVLAVVQDSDLRGARVFCSLIRDHSAGIVIFLEVNGVGRADHQP